MAMTEAKEQFAKMLRWTEQPKDQKQADSTLFVGTTLSGFYVGKRTGVGQNGSTVHEVVMMNGEKVSFWGSDLLDGKFSEIPLDCEVRVTYMGIAQPKTSKGRAYQNFTVEYDKDSRKPANLVVAGGTAPAAATGAANAAPAEAPAAESDQGF